jgi:hypothetical protein
MKQRKFLEALSVDNGRSRLIILFLGDPHLLEGGERSQDRSSDPDRVLALRGSNDLDLHGRGSEGSQLFLHSVSNSREHGGSSRENDVSVEILSDINIALHDGVVGGLVDTSRFHTQERGLEEGFGASESLVSNGDDLSVRELIGLLEGRGRGSGLHLSFEVESNVGELLLDVSNDFTFSSGGEGVTSFGEDLHEVISQISSSKIESKNGVGESISFVDGDSVGDTITRVEHNTGGSSRGIEGEHSLDGNVHGGGVEGLEHDLSHLLSVGLGVEGSLSEEDGVLFGSNSELIVEGVMPDLLHIVPVGDDSVLDGVLEGEDTSLGLSLISDIGILLSHTDHHTSVSGSSNDRGENGSRSIISSETSLAHSRSIVDNESLNFVLHFRYKGSIQKRISTLKVEHD